jgi:hypothetical protein
MRKICSWCNRVLSAGSSADAVITHSICASCVAKIEKEMAESQRLKETKAQG